MSVASAASAHVFGKYSLVAKLATGGMAEIYLARLQGMAGFEKLVCIKRILPHLAKDQQLIGMFLAEARIAAQISHPNVCQVFELGEIDGRYFIAMEYLEGVPFSCFRRRDLYGPHPDPRLIAALGVQACEGLHHAHQLKRPDGSPLEVVHRDVSSNNLFATVDGVVKVLDFGIAKVQDASVRTSTGSVKGTYAYMAPEQLRGERVDRRADVFAMGIVLWELFARRHLFKRETDYLTFQAITSDPIPDIAELRPDVPPQLAGTIARALSRDRDQRFPTARALGEALAHSVHAIGGPWPASAIADEIQRAFEVRMRDQQVLIRIAREGGVLDLEETLGPGVGHGTAMVDTPLSIVSAVEIESETTIDPRNAIAEARTMLPPAIARPVSMPPPMPEAYAQAIASAQQPQTFTGTVTPVWSRTPLIALAVLAAGGLAAAIFFATRGGSDPAVTPPAPAAERVVMSTTPAPAPAPAPPPAPAPVTPAAVEPPTTPPPATTPAPAPTTTPAPAATTSRTVKRAAPTATPATPVPSGPPGFITIDSTPVYAVIYIDGKHYGETPLVQLRLPPGRHAVRAVSPSGATRTLSITIEPGKTAPTQRIEW